MGALSAPPKWTPQDDVLLRSAVEVGASLESLAMGAVNFSHRYTLRELQDRWHTLLYDLPISKEAAARMIEHENEVSAPSTSKAIKVSNHNGKDSASEKHKIESVQSRYYSKRKRVCHELCNVSSLGFVVAPCSCDALGRECTCGYQQKHHHSFQHDTNGSNIYSSFGCSGPSYYGGENVFSETPQVDPTAPCASIHHSYHMTGGIVDGNAPNVVFDYSHSQQPFENEYIQKILPQATDGNLVSLNGCPDVQDANFQLLGGADGLNRGEEREIKQLVGSAVIIQQDNNTVNAGSFQQHDCLPTAAGVTMWTTTQDVKSSSVMTNLDIKENEQQPLVLPNDEKIHPVVNQNVFTSGDKLASGISDTELNDSMLISENEFSYINSPIIMDFVNSTDLLDLDSDEKLDCGQSDLGFLNSPVDPNQSNAVDTFSCKGTESELSLSISPSLMLGVAYTSTERQYPHTTASDNKTIVRTFDGICVVNMEDDEIPCSDDNVDPEDDLARCPDTTLDHSSQHIGCSAPLIVPPSVTPFSEDGSSAVEFTKVKEEMIETSQTFLYPIKSDLPIPQQQVVVASENDGCICVPNPMEEPSVSETFLHAGVAPKIPKPTSPTALGQCSGGAALDQVDVYSIFEEHGDFDKLCDPGLPKPITVPVPANRSYIYAASGHQQETGGHVTLNGNVQMGDCEVQRPITVMPASGHANQVFDDENDIPSFSDLESLVLEMDLVPCSEESGLLSSEISRLQNPESKKAFIRLEQGARAYMNRAIASRGALAVLYGRHLKYFIQDAEVTLGRETEDVKVDIDLNKEGQASKISRRQAIISMDNSGIFHIKNIGKCPIFVNSSEVPAMKRIVLTPGCLIEIRDFCFIFDVNQAAVRRRIIRTRASIPNQNGKLDHRAPGHHHP